VELREAGSKVAVSTEPKCYIDTGICTVTFTEDKFREATLYIPVGLPTLLFSLGALYEVGVLENLTMFGTASLPTAAIMAATAVSLAQFGYSLSSLLLSAATLQVTLLIHLTAWRISVLIVVAIVSW
jgi:hypothetical protein